MPDTTPNLQLPRILPSQAQKHVTHNEALEKLDALCQLAVLDRTRSEAPAAPQDGDRHIVAAGATGAWAGQDGAIALFTGGGWSFLAPRPGWRAAVLDEEITVQHGASGWAVPPVELSGASLDNLAELGVNATADAANRLVVASAGSLLTHEGGDHRLAINKAAAGDVASLVFQSGWTGHAEMGLSGDTNFAVKVSADGAAWTTALQADATAGTLRLDMPVTGLAVQQTAEDSTPGRLLRTGAFGLGTEMPTILGDLDNTGTAVGFYRVWPSTFGTRPAGAGIYAFVAVHRINGANVAQTLWDTVSDSSWTRRYRNNAWQSWVPLHVEEGSNANGVYRRFGPSTQMCWRTDLASGAVNTARGALFRSAEITWTFPAAFQQPPVVTGSCSNTDRWLAIGAPTTTGVAVRVLSPTSSTTSSNIQLQATGIRA